MWPRRLWRHHHAFNADRNPKSHVQLKNLSSSMIVMTHHNDHRTQRVADGTDELNFLGRPHQDRRGRFIGRANQMSISLMKVTKPFNAVNNASSGYKISCTDRWKPIKNPHY